MMAQFYLLSILANILAGLVLAGGFLAEKMPFFSSLKGITEDRNARITIGVSAAMIGIVKLFVSSPGETVPIAGDLLPALTGMVLGGVIFAEAFQGSGKDEKLERISKTVLTYKVPLGIVGIIVAILHFFFPGAPVL
jgi:hypothetical protein